MVPWVEEHRGYEVEFSRRAFKEFLALSRDTQERLTPKIEALEFDPRPRGVEKLQGFKNAYRIRIGDYRIVYEVDDEQEVITVGRVAQRAQAYRQL